MSRGPADLTGQRFERLVVLDRAEADGTKVRWRCRCECGRRCVVRADALTQGRTRSCGCLKLDTAVDNLKAKRRPPVSDDGFVRVPPTIIETARGRIVRGSRY